MTRARQERNHGHPGVVTRDSDADDRGHRASARRAGGGRWAANSDHKATPPQEHRPPRNLSPAERGESKDQGGGCDPGDRGQALRAGEPRCQAGTRKSLQNHRPGSAHPTSAPGEPLPFSGGASGFGLEPALARLAPEHTGGLFLPAWDDVAAPDVVPTFRGAGSSGLAGGLRVRGGASCASLADGLACGPSVLVWDCRAGEGLWVRA